jgi:hypothetical protein
MELYKNVYEVEITYFTLAFRTVGGGSGGGMELLFADFRFRSQVHAT